MAGSTPPKTDTPAVPPADAPTVPAAEKPSTPSPQVPPAPPAPKADKAPVPDPGPKPPEAAPEAAPDPVEVTQSARQWAAGNGPRQIPLAGLLAADPTLLDAKLPANEWQARLEQYLSSPPPSEPSVEGEE